MFELFWGAISAISFILLLSTLVYFRKERKETNYRCLFIIGLIWFPAGIIFGNNLLAILGAVCLVAGIVNKNKWKDEKKWSKLSKNEKRIKIVLTAAVCVLVGITVVLYLMR